MENVEIWKFIPIDEISSRYEVSNIGRIRCISGNCKTGNGGYRSVKSIIRKTQIGRDGYECITLKVNGKSKSYKIHRLVSMAFIDNPENKPCIDHINTIKTDNKIENLRWVTYSENNMNPLTIKRKIGISTINPWNARRRKKVYQYTLNGELVNVWDSAYSAKKEGFKQRPIHKCCTNAKKSYGDFIWSYNPL